MPARAHVVLPPELLDAVDRVAGRRKRSRFIEVAVREKLAREALEAALRETAGVVDLASYPEWASPEGVSAWVRAARQHAFVLLHRVWPATYPATPATRLTYCVSQSYRGGLG